MVCAMPKTRTGAVPSGPARRALAWAGEAGERLRTLVEKTPAYDAWSRPTGCRRDDETSRSQVGDRGAMARATEVPLETAEACLVVLKSARGGVPRQPERRLGRAHRRRPRLAGLVGAAERREDQRRVAARGDQAAALRVEAAVAEAGAEPRRSAFPRRLGES